MTWVLKTYVSDVICINFVKRQILLEGVAKRRLKESASHHEVNSYVQAMIFHEKKVELSLILEKLSIQEAKSDQFSIFAKFEVLATKTSWKIKFKFHAIPNLHRAVNRQPGYPRETRKAKLKILQKVSEMHRNI